MDAHGSPAYLICEYPDTPCTRQPHQAMCPSCRGFPTASLSSGETEARTHSIIRNTTPHPSFSLPRTHIYTYTYPDHPVKERSYLFHHTTHEIGNQTVANLALVLHHTTPLHIDHPALQKRDTAYSHKTKKTKENRQDSISGQEMVYVQTIIR
jgi:hypothetical protein